MTGDGYMSLVEDSYTDKVLSRSEILKPELKSKLPYDLHLEAVLGENVLLTLLRSMHSP